MLTAAVLTENLKLPKSFVFVVGKNEDLVLKQLLLLLKMLFVKISLAQFLNKCLHFLPQFLNFLA